MISKNTQLRIMNTNTKEVMFSSKSDEWSTPQWLFDELNEEFHFTLDVCASAENHKCEKYFMDWVDGLRCGWGGHSCFMNPPYSKVKDWIKKAYEESQKENTIVVALVPSRTDTQWFHDYCYNKKGVEIRFLRGRLKFSNSKNSAPFPSCIIIFK